MRSVRFSSSALRLDSSLIPTSDNCQTKCSVLTILLKQKCCDYRGNANASAPRAGHPLLGEGNVTLVFSFSFLFFSFAPFRLAPSPHRSRPALGRFFRFASPLQHPNETFRPSSAMVHRSSTHPTIFFILEPVETRLCEPGVECAHSQKRSGSWHYLSFRPPIELGHERPDVMLGLRHRSNALARITHAPFLFSA